jgi:hypothetical protein
MADGTVARRYGDRSLGLAGAWKVTATRGRELGESRATPLGLVTKPGVKFIRKLDRSASRRTYVTRLLGLLLPARVRRTTVPGKALPAAGISQSAATDQRTI